MITNFDLYRLANFVVNKDMYAQSMSESEFDLELKAKNLRHFRKRLGLPEDYRPGMVGVSATRLTDTDLIPFFIEGDFVVPIVSGEVTLTGWYYIVDFYTTASRTSDLISHQEVSNRLRNPITAPTVKHLVAYMIKKGLRIYPYGTGYVTNVHVLYYRKPNEPVFKLTTNPVTLEYAYDVAGSTELEWDDGSKLDILHMILIDFGYNVERQDVSQYANKMVETGK